MAYTVPQNISSNKIFITNRSELENRIDPEMNLYNKEVQHFKYETVELKKLLLKSPQYGANESGMPRLTNSEPRYIRITDIDEYGQLNDDIGVTAEKIENKYILNDNDILFARSGATVGKCYLHKSNSVDHVSFFAGYMIRFVVDTRKVLPEYLFFYTQLGVYKRWVKAIQRAAGQPNINAEEYKSLPIPLPTLQEQELIVEAINLAYTKKKDKEAEAKLLLASIDAYLLSELGITIPERNNSIQNRIFTTSYNTLSGERLDPLFHNSDLSLFGTGKYNMQPLRSVIKYFKSGIGAGKQDQALDGNGIIQIRPTNIDENGNLIFKRNVYLPLDFVGEKLMFNDVLFNNTNSQELVGKTAIVKTNETLSFSNHITVLRVDRNKILPEYLWLILNSFQRHKIFYSICTNWNNQSGVGLDVLRKLQIPLPTIEQQQEIIEHLNQVRSQAIRLQADAVVIIKNVQREIETKLLGS